MSARTRGRNSSRRAAIPSRSARSEARRCSFGSRHTPGAIVEDVRAFRSCTSSSRAWSRSNRSSGVKSSNFIFRIGLRFGEKGMARDHAVAGGFWRADGDAVIPQRSQRATNLDCREAVEDCGQGGKIPFARAVDGRVELDLDYRLFHKIELFFTNFALSCHKYVGLGNELPESSSLLRKP